ncbi:MAG TPA: NAD(P)H-binding protein, partial [Gemmatimonas sp.]|nr:NAD(P)H-binding protein [Gemmatimonas sp.]
LESLGAEIVAGDLLDAALVNSACTDVNQVITTANNAMGSGASSPNRVDLRAYANVCRAVREQQVSRIVNVTGQGLGGASSPVDFFRIKQEVDALIRECGVPWVLLAPTVFMETWVEMLIGEAIRQGKPVMLFGDGKTRANFIAVDDVAQFAVRVLGDRTIQNEWIDIGGPTTCSFADVTSMIERRMGVTIKRRHMPVPVLRAGMTVLRPFNEMAARLMSMGYFTATMKNAFTNWQPAAQRFDVKPMTVEQFVEKTFARPS